jgi:hypothetical protein
MSEQTRTGGGVKTRTGNQQESRHKQGKGARQGSKSEQTCEQVGACVCACARVRVRARARARARSLMATLPGGGPAEDGSELRSHACGVAKVEARGHAPGVGRIVIVTRSPPHSEV